MGAIAKRNLQALHCRESRVYAVQMNAGMVAVLLEADETLTSHLCRPGKQMRVNSLAQILRRITDPVEAFGFLFVPRNLPPSLLDGIRDGLGEETNLFDQLEEGQANELQGIHKVASRPFVTRYRTGCRK